jgi:hypothetical protein
MNTFLEASSLGGLLARMPNGFRIDRVIGDSTNKQPLLRSPHAKRPPPGGYVQTRKPDM